MRGPTESFGLDREKRTNWATSHLPEFVEPEVAERSFDSKIEGLAVSMRTMKKEKTSKL